MGIYYIDESFHEIIMFFQENIGRPTFVEMRRKVKVTNEVNNFASVNFGHCAKFKHLL